MSSVMTRWLFDKAQRLAAQFNEPLTGSKHGFGPAGRRRRLLLSLRASGRTTGLHGLYGAMQMKVALFPARDTKIGEAAEILEDGAVALLRRHGF